MASLILIINRKKFRGESKKDLEEKVKEQDFEKVKLSEKTPNKAQFES